MKWLARVFVLGLLIAGSWGCGHRSAGNGGPEDPAIRVVEELGGLCYRPPDYADFYQPEWLKEVNGNPVVEVNLQNEGDRVTDAILGPGEPADDCALGVEQ